MCDRHVHVSGKYCNQQRSQSIRGHALKRLSQQTNPAQHFCRATQQNQTSRPGQEWGHDPDVGFWKKKVQKSRNDEERGEEDSPGYSPAPAGLPQRV